jgi:p-aminobenzoyl-glutamate transporter AbgT
MHAQHPRLAGPIAAIANSSSGIGAVIVVASIDVVPWRTCKRAMSAIAWPPCIVSLPPPP